MKDFTGKEHRVPIYTARVSLPTFNGHLIRVIGIDKEYALVGRDILNHYKVTLDGRQETIAIE